MFKLLADEVTLYAYGTTAVVSVHAEASLDNHKETHLVALHQNLSVGRVFADLTLKPAAIRASVRRDIFGSQDTVFVKDYGPNACLWDQLIALSIVSPTPEQTLVVDDMGSRVHEVKLLL